MGYYIDLKSIGIDEYKQVLKTTHLIPSWKILEKNIDKNLDIIKKQNIQNLDELLVALKDKSKIQLFSKQSGISEDYLTVLRRVVNGYRKKPNRIKDFPEISEEVIMELEKVKIKNTLQLFDKVCTSENRKTLSKQTGIDENVILRLARLTDLSRIRWVNHTFAYVLLEAGYDTAEKVANTDSQKLYETVKQLNKEREIYNAHIGVNDMKMVIESAKGLCFEMEFE